MGQGQSSSKRPSIDPTYLQPRQLPSNSQWDPRIIRKLVLDRKLAPFYRGEDDEGGDKEECPICFLYYPGGLNRSNCCGQGICSECFLQVSPRANKSAHCPFCKASAYATTFRGPMATADRERLQAEEQRVIEHQIEARNREEKAYLDRLSERGIAPPQGLANGMGAGSSSGALPIPGADESREGSRGASLDPSVGASPLSSSPYESFSASPRLAPPVNEADDDYNRRWLEAQQMANEQAMRGSASASPPTLPELDARSASAHLRTAQAFRESAEAGEAWQAELEELMLLEAIRQSLHEQPGGGGEEEEEDDDDEDPGSGGGSGGVQAAALAAQLAAQVESSIRAASGGGGGGGSADSGGRAGRPPPPPAGATAGRPEPMFIPPPTLDGSAGGSANEASGEAAAVARSLSAAFGHSAAAAGSGSGDEVMRLGVPLGREGRPLQQPRARRAADDDDEDEEEEESSALDEPHGAGEGRRHRGEDEDDGEEEYDDEDDSSEEEEEEEDDDDDDRPQPAHRADRVEEQGLRGFGGGSSRASRTPSDDLNDHELQLALALSLSLQEASQPQEEQQEQPQEQQR